MRAQEKALVGFVVGWRQTDAANYAMDGFAESRAKIAIEMNVFPKREHAEIILAAEKLKNPTLDYSIFEVYEGK